jgi:LysM repeat protein
MRDEVTYGQTFAIAATWSVLVAASIVLPLTVHAGLFSSIFGNKEARASEEATAPESIALVPLLRAPLRTDPLAPQGGGDILVEDGALVSYGDITEKDAENSRKSKNGEISVYIVREGDTLSEIAEMFDVSAKTILWANDISNPAKIRPGDALIILPITGVRHVVKQGDTLATIAKKYSGDVEDILAYNQLSADVTLKVGDTLVIPDGTIASASTPKASISVSGGSGTSGASSGFVNPLPGAVRSQGIHGYNGVDLAAPAGTPVRAAQAGQVIVARASGWNGGYGFYVVIKHANGTQTLYAHLSALYVTTGDSVVSGQNIGAVGSTGRSTGNHLHFEVRGARNPF